MRPGPKPAAELLAQERERLERYVKMGSKGGKRSLETMTPEQRRARSRKAVAAREAKRNATATRNDRSYR